MKSKIQDLMIEVEGVVAVARYGKRSVKVELKQRPLLWGIAKVAGDLRRIKTIEARMGNATFSTTRQIVATVNTLAWQLGVKVNGRKQMRAAYSGEPNITV